MKILFNLGTLRKGGAERVVANLSNYLAENNNDVSIVISVEKQSYYKLNNNVKLYGLDRKKASNNFLIKNISRLKRLNHIVRTIKPDIIISFLPEPSYRVLALKLFNKKLKVIVSVRNDPKIEYKTKINRIVMKILYPLADGFVFQTKEAKEYFSKKIQQKSVIIPNPIDKKIIQRKVYTGKKEKKIVAVGRLVEQKNHELLINAFNLVKDQIPEYNLIIYGEGSLREKLQEQIERLNLKERVFLPGNVDNIADKIENASLFVLSSNYEGMPNALMEAMALGLICISTDCPCGGPRFLIENNVNGYLINVGKEKELANKIKEIIVDKKQEELEEVSNNARKKMLQMSEEKIGEIWFKYICSVTKKHI